MQFRVAILSFFLTTEFIITQFWEKNSELQVYILHFWGKKKSELPFFYSVAEMDFHTIDYRQKTVKKILPNIFFCVPQKK